jgi:hypothetical protein
MYGAPSFTAMISQEREREIARQAATAWQFETPKADRTGYLSHWRQRVGAYLIALGERVAERTQATSGTGAHRPVAS